MEYKLIDHTADMGMLVAAQSKESLFAFAPLAMMEIILGKGFPRQGEKEIQDISIEGMDLVDLMVRWLGEVLYLFEGKGLVYTGIQDIQIGSQVLAAKIITIPYSPGIHEIQCDIKAVTYHMARVEEAGGHWEAAIIFDV